MAFIRRDARQYAGWGVDYLKYDWCHSESLEARAAYETMSDALRATARPMAFSICEWGTYQPWLKPHAVVMLKMTPVRTRKH